MKLSSVKFYNYHLFTGDLDCISLSDRILITTINQYSFCIAENDPVFKKALQESEVLLPDGVGVVVASNFIDSNKIKKIAGADIHNFLLEKLQSGGKCFYLGSTNGTLQKIKMKVKDKYPLIDVDYYSPPYKSEFSDQDNLEMIERINTFRPDILFVGMTAPKQEKWAAANRGVLNANVICCIGAVFDFYAGTVTRPKKVWINLGLEWMVRFIKEPRRMWKRYFYFGPKFIGVVLKGWFNKRLLNIPVENRIRS